MRFYKLTTFLASCVVAICGVLPVFAADAETTFPFVIEKGAPDNISNVQTWDGAKDAAAGADGFIKARQGEFFEGGEKVRLLGTNLCFGANFCSHEKAERLAATLARFGIGVVRLHHMDSHDIWGKNIGKGKTEIDPEKLERLDYLISRLHEKGIYVNINLHVSRAFGEIDGFENASELPSQNKGVDNFDRRMIELQKKYAKDLLTHVNPYTGKAYVDDPGVAVIEINNENSVVASWSWGELDKLPEPYAGEFKALWNGWLQKKYRTTAALREAWNCRSVPFGDEQVRVGAFDQDFKFNAGTNWNIELDGKTKVSSRVLPPEESGLDSSALQVKVDETGEVSWRPQFHCVGLSVKKGEPYQIRFKIRANKDRDFSASVKQNHDPWNEIGYQDSVAATTTWKDVEATFVAPTDDGQVRLTFNGFEPGDVIELADVSFRQGGDVGLSADASLEEGEVPVLKGSGSGKTSGAEALADFAEFLHDIENDYWREMFDYVKGLGAKSVATGTQLQYGFWHNQARLDYCDIHAYWNHPTFPHRQWDGNDWLVKNTCMANTPINGTLTNLAALRVVGRPFTCSEYDHPYPNSYAAEGNLMLSAVAAFQDWSAIFQFAWSHGDDFEREMAIPFFDMCATQTKMAHLPACYAMFVRGDVQAGPGEFVYAPTLTEREEVDAMKGALYSYHRPLAQALGLDKSLSLAVYSGLDLTDLNLETTDKVASAKRVSSWNDLPDALGSPEKKEIVNEFGELKWNFQKRDKGFFVVDAARCKVFSGFVTEPTRFDAVKLEIGKTILDWATVSLVKAKGVSGTEEKNGVLSKGSYLLTATGELRNTDAVYKITEDNSITSAGAYGGSNGRAPALCEGIPATITLDGLRAENVKVYALDESGNRAKDVPVADKDGVAAFEIGPEYRTIWYEVVVGR